MKRRVSKHILSTYLPSLCILIVAQVLTFHSNILDYQVSVYFNKEHFKPAIPLAIPAMLVMYTLKGSISARLPVTSYIKFIDIWLLYGLIMPFLILIMIVLIEHLPKKSQVNMILFEGINSIFNPDNFK
jgi:uncharacterized membrane protein